jgi:hypothetical protein
MHAITPTSLNISLWAALDAPPSPSATERTSFSYPLLPVSRAKETMTANASSPCLFHRPEPCAVYQVPRSPGAQANEYYQLSDEWGFRPISGLAAERPIIVA